MHYRIHNTATHRLRRALLATLLAIFVLSALAHAGHVHAATKSGGTAQVELCGHCTAWGGVAGPAAGPAAPLPLALFAAVAFLAVPRRLRRRPLSSARARAPPCR